VCVYEGLWLATARTHIKSFFILLFESEFVECLVLTFCRLYKQWKIPSSILEVAFQITFVAMPITCLRFRFIITYFNSSEWELMRQNFFRFFHNTKKKYLLMSMQTTAKKKKYSLQATYIFRYILNHYKVCSSTAFCVSV
jgi:hypothetical protein